MDDAEKLKILSHVDNLVRYARQSGNEWLLDEFRKKLSAGSDANEIYELFNEDIIKKQAVGFYENFPLRRITQHLVFFFVMMEQCRRKNAFNDFVVAVYKQIECIADEICKNSKFEYAALRLMGHPAFVGNVRNDDGTWSSPTIESRTGSYQIAHLLFGKDYAALKVNGHSCLSTYSSLDKIRSVLYFICFEAKLPSASFGDFINQKNTLEDIYNYYNKVKYFGEYTEWRQEVYDRVQPRQGFYYMKFMQSLCTFVEGVSHGISSSVALYKYAVGQTPIEVKKAE